MALAAGNIAFVGFNADGNDNIAFVALADIGSGEKIIFEDNEWNGTAFVDTNEGAFSWTANSIVSAGTIVRIDNIGTGTIAANIGTVSTPVAGRGTNRGIAGGDETIYAYQGTAAAPTFITAIANGGFSAANGVLTNTGLTVGVNAIDLGGVDDDADIAAFNGSRTGQASFAGYLAAINNPANWQTQDATGDQSSDGTAPDVPFSAVAFTIAGGNPSVNLAASANAGSEAGTTIITLTATAGSAVVGDQSVTIAAAGTNITVGDFNLSSNPITIPNGQLTGSVTFTILDDLLAEGTETATLTISNPTAGITLGTTIAQNIVITDNDVVISAAPTIAENTATPFLNLAATGAGAASGVINDPTDPAKTLGIDFTIADTDTPIGNLTVTATSNNPSVVANVNLTIAGTGASRNLKINPTGVGLADITVTVSDGASSNSYVINYAASAASVNPSTTRFLTGTSDASSAIAIDADYMFVADDEDQTIRLYDRNESGLPVASFDFTSSLGLVGASEVDIEASTRSGNTIYWLGSHSNNSSSADRPNRERIFSTTIAGTGANSTLSFGGYYQFLEDDAIAWDNSNGHGLGAGFLGLAASAAAGVSPEQTNGFNIEGLTIAPNGSTAYLAFRAPNEPTTTRPNALIIPVTNFTSLLNSTGGTSGSATFGAPIQLDLGGRGIRSIDRNASNEYVIIAGPAGAATGTAPADFRLYTWTGNAVDVPVLRSTDLTALNANGSFESIVEVPNALTGTTQLQLLVDNGDTVWYNDGQISKELTRDNFQKFRSETISVGTAVGGTTATKISTIQGTGTAATAGIFTIEGIVVGDFQGTGQLGGFYLQEENSDADGNPLTSEGIFVNSLTAVNVGDKVRVTGTVAENALTPSFNQAVITPTTAADISVLAIGQQALVTGTVLDLPITTLGDLERYEGMLITIPETLTVTEVFNLGRFGEVSLSADGRLFNPTNIIDPNDAVASGTNSSGTSNVAAVTAQQDLNNRRRILLDDGSSLSNLSDVAYIDTTDASTANDTLRIGSTIAGLTGVLGFGFNNYRIQPTQAPVFNYEPRPALPDVGGGIKVGSFNVLNYFNGDGLGGGFPTTRGANTEVEFSRQRDKIISAIKDLNADVVGLIEMENDGDGANSGIANLVNGLNASIGSNTYDYIKLANTTGSPGTDEIKVAFIYKLSAVTPVGNAVYFNDPAFTSLGRPPLAQTFINNASGEKFTPIVNHFKSKGAGGATGADLDQNDGQGAYNATRKAQSTALLNFVSQLQTASGDSDVMVLGDLNAYNEEDPIDILRAGGLTKLATTTDSYVFDGQTGSLDHALVTSNLFAQVTGTAKWNINSSEPIVLDYNDDVLSPGENVAEDRNDTTLYAPDRFRSSDHDPVLAGLNLKPTGGNPGADNQVGTDGSDTLFGNAGNDIINGSGGNDFIIGGAGVDLLFGGAGNDTFVFYAANEGIDKINDFVVGQDRLSFSRAGFGNAAFDTDGLGVLNALRFTLGSSANNASQRFIYNNNSGALFFDADGAGGTAQVRIAQLVGNPGLTNNSFSLF